MMDKNDAFLSYQTERQQILDKLLLDLECFRKNAQESCESFSKNDRRLVDGISSDEYVSSRILDLYVNDTCEKVRFLQKKIVDQKLQQFMIKNLILNDEICQSKINEIFNKRISEEKESFVSRMSFDNKLNKEQTEMLCQIISKPESDVEQLRKRQISFILYKEISAINNITIYDPIKPFFTKVIAKKRIKKEKKMWLFNKKKRLELIRRRLDELKLINNGMICEIEKNNWKLIEVIGLRNSYDKKVSQLSKNYKDNAVKRLEIFDQITLEFKNKQLEKNVINSNKISLELTRAKIKEIDTLLLRIFDLSNIQKNQLVLQMKEYRELIDEQNIIERKITTK